MLIDITLPVTPEMVKNAPENGNRSLLGHLGTHFDVMEQEFPLEYTRRPGIAFDVSGIRERDIDLGDIALDTVTAGSFVAFYTGYIAEVGYGNRTYFGEHPQLSHRLIEALVERGVSIIGLDCAGIRRGSEHVPKDRYCAEKGTFVIENLCCLDEVLQHGGRFTAHTYPVRYSGMTGLPCRVIAEV